MAQDSIPWKFWLLAEIFHFPSLKNQLFNTSFILCLRVAYVKVLIPTCCCSLLYLVKNIFNSAVTD